jgi:argininosuccinate synthase
VDRRRRRRAAGEPAELTIGFEAACRSASTAARSTRSRSSSELNELAGAHGVGRIDHVEDRLVGIKSREIYEAPAAVTLHAAHRALEALTLTKEQLRFNRRSASELAQATYDGLWFSALQRDLREYVALRPAQVVSGEVSLRLDHGSATGRRAAQPDHSLYDQALATYDAGDAFDHASAVGFIASGGCRCAPRRPPRLGLELDRPLLPDLPLEVSEPEAGKVVGMKTWGGRFEASARRAGRRLRAVGRVRPPAGRRRPGGSIAHVRGLGRAGI